MSIHFPALRRSQSPCREAVTLALLIPLIALLLLSTTGALAQNQQPATSSNSGTNGVKGTSAAPAQIDSMAVQRTAALADLNRQIATATADLNELIKQQSSSPASKDDPELKTRIEEERATIARLRASFEQIAIGGIDLSSLEQQKPAAKYNWQDELVEIVKPVLGSLKELTEKPRKIEALRSEIDRTRQSLTLVRRALSEIEQLNASDTTPAVRERIATLKSRWLERQDEATSRLQVLRTQLESLNENDTWAWSSFTTPLHNFATGRGLTLLIAIVGCWLIWVLSRRVIEWIAMRQPASANRKERRSWERTTRYLGTLLAGLLMLISVLALFYWRNDILLLALALVATGAILIGARHTVPRYMREIRLLLDIGPVRENERILYRGIPMEVKSIGAFAILRNPMLTGIVRLPLDDLHDMVSRPSGKEPWFPTEKGDYAWVKGDTFAQVLSQSIEVVELKVAGSPLQMPTTDFLGSEPKNITREGFVVPVTFGIDYQHQAISLDTVPQAMEKALRKGLAGEDYGDDLTAITVTFKEAAASSLDYLVLVTAKGSVAGSYFAIGRAIQRILVELCNEQGWEIPFSQLTVHQRSADSPD